jgi:hypothetical protein
VEGVLNAGSLSAGEVWERLEREPPARVPGVLEHCATCIITSSTGDDLKRQARTQLICVRMAHERSHACGVHHAVLATIAGSWIPLASSIARSLT